MDDQEAQEEIKPTNLHRNRDQNLNNSLDESKEFQTNQNFAKNQTLNRKNKSFEGHEERVLKESKNLVTSKIHVQNSSKSFGRPMSSTLIHRLRCSSNPSRYQSQKVTPSKTSNPPLFLISFQSPHISPTQSTSSPTQALQTTRLNPIIHHQPAFTMMMTLLAKRERLRKERDKIKPSYYYGEKELEVEAIKKGIKPPKLKRKGLRGVPVFEPSMEQFRDFYSYINLIDRWGMRSGIVKIIPPKEWTGQLPHLGKESLRTDGQGQMLRNAKIKSPISQVIQGSRGLFRVMNVAKRKTYNALEWYDLANSDEHRPPDFLNKTLVTSSANLNQDNPDKSNTRSTRSSRRSTSSIAPISHKVANPRRRKVSKGHSTADISISDRNSSEKPDVEGRVDCSPEKRDGHERPDGSCEKRDLQKTANCSPERPDGEPRVDRSPGKRDAEEHVDFSPSNLLPVPEDPTHPCNSAKEFDSSKPEPCSRPEKRHDEETVDCSPEKRDTEEHIDCSASKLLPVLEDPSQACNSPKDPDFPKPAPGAPAISPQCSPLNPANEASNNQLCPAKADDLATSCTAEHDLQPEFSNAIENQISEFVDQSLDLQMSCVIANQPTPASAETVKDNDQTVQENDKTVQENDKTVKENDKKKPRRSVQNVPTPEEWAQFVERYEKLPYDASRSDYTFQVCREIEQEYWRTIGNGGSPMYGADTMGSLFDERTKDWNVATLDNLLNRLKLKKKIPGVNTPYLYFGTWRATFAWHVEDADLYSINYIHFGAPKFWYSIPQEQNTRFENFMSSSFAKERRTCSQFLRHKAFLASPSVLQSVGVQLNKVVHLPGEIILTYPYGYHSGFNLGYNCAESVNFANEAWIEKGRKAQSCKCIDDAVTINVDAWLEEHDELCRKESEARERAAQKLQRQQKCEERKRKGSDNLPDKAPKKKQKKDTSEAVNASLDKMEVDPQPGLNNLADSSLPNPSPQTVKAPQKKKTPQKKKAADPPPGKADDDLKPDLNNPAHPSLPNLAPQPVKPPRKRKKKESSTSTNPPAGQTGLSGLVDPLLLNSSCQTKAKAPRKPRPKKIIETDADGNIIKKKPSKASEKALKRKADGSALGAPSLNRKAGVTPAEVLLPGVPRRDASGSQLAGVAGQTSHHAPSHALGITTTPAGSPPLAGDGSAGPNAHHPTGESIFIPQPSAAPPAFQAHSSWPESEQQAYGYERTLPMLADLSAVGPSVNPCLAEPGLSSFPPDIQPVFENEQQSSDPPQLPNLSYFSDQKFMSAIEAGLIDSRLL
ncbi:hypothetical protein PtA15_16A41 [Puccinia triticina]|uniref:[Histone H3]-trimethyl-L-lysine(9) demethylase n=1 Tax=Puccinia triticina TaxID=208348 RepID=A0ABY7D802_9BASI|nr:uncharacterized protein PtA15_16A41 [Puccinia triticina]WAQ92135.1 hypothetical protein PtA15_16A41 [Puccinia triticina]WAR63882.1 hypothetical protein PtB15_16B41 [Puccinia triticina]